MSAVNCQSIRDIDWHKTQDLDLGWHKAGKIGGRFFLMEGCP